ncbi:MAG: redoxin domain-containing protein [Chloroflexi bacterium]|nr:redoxin domain-containing protein [Chloroflexota bacterium]
MRAAGAEILAISTDHNWTHRAFTTSLGGLPFPLLADWDKQVTRRYGILDENRGSPKRAVFIVDCEGIVRFKNDAFDARNPGHYDEALEAVAALP